MGRSKRVRVALAVAGAIVVLVIAALAVVHLPFVQRAVLEQARQFADSSGFQLEAADLDYNLLTGHVWLRGIVVRANGAADPTPLFQADLLDINLGVRGVFRKRLHIEQGRLVRPQLAAI